MEKLTLIRQPIEKEFLLYDRLYESTLRSENALLNEVLMHTAHHRGKQLRPLLTLLAAKICNPVTEKTLQAAVALELLHTATLMHDDVVDNSPTRRGGPSVPALWTNKVAVLVGDYLLAKVIGITADIHNGRILAIIAHLGQMLSSGELLQLHAGGTMWITEEQYFKIIDQKTAQLFQACMEAGAESAGCTQRQRTALREFGRLFGLCFQIKDDIFDYFKDDAIGKPTGNDLREGKVTLPLIYALSHTESPRHEEMRRLADSDSLTTEQIETLIDFAKAEGGIEYAYATMERLRAEARSILEPYPDNEAKRAFLSLFDYIIKRHH